MIYFCLLVEDRIRMNSNLIKYELRIDKGSQGGALYLGTYIHNYGKCKTHIPPTNGLAFGRVCVATQKSSLKLTWPTPGRTQNCRREVYSTGLVSGKFRVTSAGVGVWRWIENEADPIQDGGGRTQTPPVGDHYDASGGLFRPGGRCYRPQEEKEVRVGQTVPFAA